ncbi:TPA: hypothetical protein ACYJH5_004762, partial [Salmonella enterica]
MNKWRNPTGWLCAVAMPFALLLLSGYLDSWQYDAAANLLDRRQGETAQAGAGSVVPFNRITSYRGLHYRYDEYGRVVEKRGRNGTQHYRWDAEHRLTEVAVIRGSTVRRYG